MNQKISVRMKQYLPCNIFSYITSDGKRRIPVPASVYFCILNKFCEAPVLAYAHLQITLCAPEKLFNTAPSDESKTDAGRRFSA